MENVVRRRRVYPGGATIENVVRRRRVYPGGATMEKNGKGKCPSHLPHHRSTATRTVVAEKRRTDEC